MSTTPAGWYDDPYPGPYGPGGLRWWDGTQWTQHVTPRPTPGAALATTPDGEPLAGWGRRFGAYLLDSLVISVLALLLGSPFLIRIGHAYADLFRATVRAQQDGTTPPNQFTVYTHEVGAFLGLAAVYLVVNLCYQVAFLRWRGATLGKLALGLRVRLRDQPGRLPWSTILRRWAGQFGIGVLGLVPFVGSLASVYQLVDGLWPLGDGRRQALHDKLAGTNVVHRR